MAQGSRGARTSLSSLLPFFFRSKSLARPGIYPTLLLCARGHLSARVCVCVYQKDATYTRAHVYTVIDKSPRHATDFPSPFFKHSSNEGLPAATCLSCTCARPSFSPFFFILDGWKINKGGLFRRFFMDFLNERDVRRRETSLSLSSIVIFVFFLGERKVPPSWP